MAAKLPLIARKNIRDEYEAKIPALLAQIKEYTGEDYKFIVNFQEKIYPNIDASQSYQAESPGSIAYSTYEAFVDNLKRITDDGEDQLVKDHFNQVVSSREIDIVIEDMESGHTACRVKNGILELVFKTGGYGTNNYYITEKLIQNLDEAFAETNKGELPLEAQVSWQKAFVEKKEKLEAEIAEELNGEKIKLVANPSEVWAVAVEEWGKLKKREREANEIDLESIRRNMGDAIFSYFDGFRYQINYKFKGDEMMVEAFMEECSTKEIRFQLVPTKEELTRSYNDAIFKDGAYVIRASPKTWYTNSSYACDEVDKQL